jgi:hypothetical protein
MNTSQQPLQSGFGPFTTAQDVIANSDLAGRIAIVTGGYSGLGLETTRALAQAGATSSSRPDRRRKRAETSPVSPMSN